MNYNQNEEENQINIELPKSTISLDGESNEKRKIKGDLIKLIIDTKDEPIELKLKGEHYKKVGISSEWRRRNCDNAAFSYQEKAVKDFIFKFNRCGILSDQVGMGKTIEAGMIVSELAYRKELGSLLVLVPNENMAEKWEIELARKFGFRNYYKDLIFRDGKSEKKILYKDLPQVCSVQSLEDIYALIYDALVVENDSIDKKITTELQTVYKQELVTNGKKYKERISKILNTYKLVQSKEFKTAIFSEVYAPFIETLVKKIAKKLEYVKMQSDFKINTNGQYYHIIDMLLEVQITTEIAEKIFEKLFDFEIIEHSITKEFNSVKANIAKKLIEEINKQSNKIVVDKYKKIAQLIREKYEILIVSKTVTYNDDTKYNLLNHTINKNYESEMLKHVSLSTIEEKGYKVIDLLIDMFYKTLIVDEAHDYIKVSHKIPMRSNIIAVKDYKKRQQEGIEFSDIDITEFENKYFIFPLYNDYYFIEKDSLYLKLKALAERSYRKIFMTATPIKSDMIDFYLLYFLADHNDTGIINRIRKALSTEQISKIINLINNVMTDNQKKAMNYSTYIDLVIKYVYEEYKEQEEQQGNFDEKITQIAKNIIENATIDKNIIQKICINNVRLQFQNTFTINVNNSIQEIHSISELVSSDEGIRQWQNMYSQIGIRSTRHQTYRLGNEQLKKIKSIQREKYVNLPVWSRRNGTIIYIHQKDNFFDVIVKQILNDRKDNRVEDSEEEKLYLKENTIDKPRNRELDELNKEKECEINKIKQNENIDNLTDDRLEILDKKYNEKKEEILKKYKPIATALNIYKYINEEMTGVLNTSDYYSKEVDYDDFKRHMIVKLMTNGLEFDENDEKKTISGKVLVFADETKQVDLYNWLLDQLKPTSKENNETAIATYESKYKHPPLWYFNKKNPELAWNVTTDIRALKEKKGNYLIVVEPNKYEEGVDLQSSNTLINYDIKFCPLKMEQRIGRIDRVKLDDTQPQLEIISFTPLNDMSGFMVDFLANELKMFSCWRGDTTGIVAMPLGERPNSATFESAILAINDVYKSFYDINYEQFIKSCNNLSELGKNFNNDDFDSINALLNKKKPVETDFKFLKRSHDSLNKIVANIECNSTNSLNSNILFGSGTKIVQDKAFKEGRITKDEFTNSKNDLALLRESIENYYKINLEAIQKEFNRINNIKSNANEERIERSNKTDENLLVDELTDVLKELKSEYELYKGSELAGLHAGALGIKKAEVDKIVNPILYRVEDVVKKYINLILNLFDSFCREVKDKSSKMSKFISNLTINEFSVMAANDDEE